ncbi:DUF6602 domain-containing protein [Streptomyces virginiae]|uniref:DUF6602 domain-containing protein n=1 Tax=Streptomyces virginiae TaxID=1961 RepID=UPI002DB9476B|nr:DUF6602 domain-containing protein [Streptomyces sp. CMAA1738]MEC4573645.1 DUF6602 domain-containing protein [Streptomyces sp. CMAA1738]
MSQSELTSYFQQATMEMQLEYERIRARTSEDPGTAGDEGEENWANLLQKWLPGDIQIATKGRILCADGTATNQVDVVALSPLYPHGMLGKKMHLASEVLAVFECKTTLRGSHIERTMESASRAKEAIYRSHRKEILYGLVAHSHSFGDDVVKAAEKISRKIASAGLSHVEHPNNLLDFVCVADLGSWVVRAEMDEEYYGPGMVTYYSGPPTRNSRFAVNGTPPIGRMVTYTLRRLSHHYPKYQGLSGYFGMAGLEGGGSWSSDHLRHWEDFGGARDHVSLFT